MEREGKGSEWGDGESGGGKKKERGIDGKREGREEVSASEDEWILPRGKGHGKDYQEE